MADFLLELRCEEIPARMQAGARADLERLFRAEMDAAGVAPGAITVWSTPRRLALIARDLPEQTQAVSEETKGPPVGAPEQALEGFLRKVGLTKDQLQVRDLKGKDTYFAVVERPGRAVREVLVEAIPAIVRAFPWPKSMRWGAASLSTESLRWVRPLSGIVAILGEDLIECEVGGVASGYATKGHRFHHPDIITIGSAADYADKLRACHVLVDHEERQALIRDKARAAASAAGLKLVEDEGLVIENAGLTEWPVPLLGRFDEAFLDVPPEVIQLTARVNQKYFVCEDAAGKLANAFVCTANIEAADGGEAIVAGNRKVLAARLSDARFFWEQDLRVVEREGFDGFLRRLDDIVFHAQIGTIGEKVRDVAEFARYLIHDGVLPGERLVAERASQLMKADLVTSTVSEFPELQGIIGSYLARAARENESVILATKWQYFIGDDATEFPDDPIAIAVAIAERLDTLISFFAIDEKPSGSRDPYALRRAAISLIAIILAKRVRMSLFRQIIFHFTRRSEKLAVKRVGQQIGTAIRLGQVIGDGPLDLAAIERIRPELFAWEQATNEPINAQLDRMLDLVAFIIDRLKVQQREAGVRHDLIDAVFALGGEDDLVRLLARVHALQAFIGTEDGANLLAGYKRAANILKKEEYEPGATNPSPEPAEKALIDALAVAGPKAEAAVAAEDFAGAMAALATLRSPIDAFFDAVTVNDADPAKRAARLALLDAFRVAVHNVADFSRIEG